MTSKGKEIYKTLKRQISGSVGEVLSSSSGTAQTVSTGAKYGGGSGKTWIHPPDVLLNGRVEYAVKLLGSKEVQKPKGTDTIREAIHAIRFQLQVKRSETGHAGAKLQKVDIQINVEGVTVVDTKTKMVLHRYPLQRISFCADDKQDKRVFSFIAKAEDSPRHDCFVFLSEKLAEQITLTVGEAFDLAYKRYMDRNKLSLENQKQILVLKKRIAELEAENQVLTERLAESIRSQHRPPYQGQSSYGVPPIPTSPMPSGPPPTLQMPQSPAGSAASNCSNPFVTSSTHSPCFPAPSYPPPPFYSLPHAETTTTNSLLDKTVSATHSSSSISTTTLTTQPPSLAPPPPIVPRRTIQPQNSTASEIGRRLEGLNLHQIEDVFDDSFDPRSDEKKKEEEEAKNGSKDPFGDSFLAEVLETGHKASKATADEIEKMISMVDQRLAEMSDGFSDGRLEMGDTGDNLRDIENEYGVPSNTLPAPTSTQNGSK